MAVVVYTTAAIDKPCSTVISCRQLLTLNSRVGGYIHYDVALPLLLTGQGRQQATGRSGTVPGVLSRVQYRAFARAPGEETANQQEETDMAGIVKLKDSARQYAEAEVQHEVRAGGLANEFKGLVCHALNEKDSDRSMTSAEKYEVYKEVLGLIETEMRELIDSNNFFEKDTPISRALPQYRQRKSEMKKAIQADLDPRDFKSWSKLKAAKLAADKPKTPGDSGDGAESTGSAGSGGDSGGAGESGPTPVPNSDNLTEKQRKLLNEALKVLDNLPDEQKTKVLKGFKGAAHAALASINPRMSNVS